MASPLYMSACCLGNQSVINNSDFLLSDSLFEEKVVSIISLIFAILSLCGIFALLYPQRNVRTVAIATHNRLFQGQGLYHVTKCLIVAGVLADLGKNRNKNILSPFPHVCIQKLSCLMSLQQSTSENIVANGEIDHNEEFLLLPQCFQHYSKIMFSFIGSFHILYYMSAKSAATALLFVKRLSKHDCKFYKFEKNYN